MQDYHKLEIWQRAMDYAVAVYQFSEALPQLERFNLTDQLRRAVSSIPLNIAEGAACSGNTEFGRFLGYAYRSAKEVVTALELARRLFPALPEPSLDQLIDEGEQLSRMVHSFISRVDRARTHPGSSVRPTQNS